MKNVNIHVLGVRVHEKPIYRGGGGLGKFADLRGCLTRKSNAHYGTSLDHIKYLNVLHHNATQKQL